MSERGVFAVDRGIFEHDFFAPEPFTEREAWIWMIGVAAYRPYRARVGPARIELARGQLAHSSRFMAEKWKWGETSVRRFLARLKAEGMVGFGARTAHAITVITICNYEAFQKVSLPDDDENGADMAQGRRRVEAIGSIEVDRGGDARASDVELFEQAKSFITELAAICAQDPEFWTPAWVSAGPVERAKAWLRNGWRVDVMRDAAKAAVHKKRDGPPASVLYFDKIFQRAHAPQLPLPLVQVVHSSPEAAHVQENRSPADWRYRKDDAHAAFAELRAHNAAAKSAPTGGGPDDGEVVSILRDARRL